MNVLIVKVKDGWYPINAVDNICLKQQAKDNGELNDHIISIEDVEGNTLWKRQIQ